MQSPTHNVFQVGTQPKKSVLPTYQPIYPTLGLNLGRESTHPWLLLHHRPISKARRAPTHQCYTPTCTIRSTCLLAVRALQKSARPSGTPYCPTTALGSQPSHVHPFHGGIRKRRPGCQGRMLFTAISVVPHMSVQLRPPIR